MTEEKKVNNKKDESVSQEKASDKYPMASETL